MATFLAHKPKLLTFGMGQDKKDTILNGIVRHILEEKTKMRYLSNLREAFSQVDKAWDTADEEGVEIKITDE